MERALYFPLLLVTTISCLATSQVSFDGYQVHRVTPVNIEQISALRDLEENFHGLDFWTDIRAVGQPVDIMVPPNIKEDFLKMIHPNFTSEVWIENVQKLVLEKSPKKSSKFGWEDYYELETIYEWLDYLVKKHAGIVTRVVGGKTYEGRKIRGVKVSFGPGRKGAFLEGGIHAREWIGPATVTYILNALLTSNNPDVRAVAKSRDWYVFPVFNPDGYAYTHTTNRLWRKTRKPYGHCHGADPNRNWGYHWMHGGASSSPCSDTYAGSSAFSEIETKSLSKYISSIGATLDTYIAFHSYSQLLMMPFGHAGLEVPKNNRELRRIGKAAAKSLAVRYGTRYRVGNIPEVIYVASGGSMDWAVGVHRNIRIAYTYELRDTGRHGFLLPKEQIVPTGEETLDSLVTIIKEADASQIMY